MRHRLGDPLLHRLVEAMQVAPLGESLSSDPTREQLERPLSGNRQRPGWRGRPGRVPAERHERRIAEGVDGQQLQLPPDRPTIRERERIEGRIRRNDPQHFLDQRSIRKQVQCIAVDGKRIASS